MALRQLATNSGKYGAWSSPTGVVTVSWLVERNGAETPRLRLIWLERFFTVAPAETVADATTRATAVTFVIAVLDLNLQGQSAGSVASAVVEAGKSIVFSTGLDVAEIAAEFRKWPVLYKPDKDTDVRGALIAAVIIPIPFIPAQLPAMSS